MKFLDEPFTPLELKIGAALRRAGVILLPAAACVWVACDELRYSLGLEAHQRIMMRALTYIYVLALGALVNRWLMVREIRGRADVHSHE